MFSALEKFRNRNKSAATLILASLVWAIWGLSAWHFDKFSLFHTNWFMSITMAVGSFIAGATSEGGGAVAFPVMTLFFKIPPSVARDFSLAIQAVGMTSAAITIYWRRIAVVPSALVYASLGGAIGVAFGIDVLSPLVSPAVVKLFFVSLWLSFGTALAAVHIKYQNNVPNAGTELANGSFRYTIFCLGLIGGTVSGLVGSGLDILVFSYLVLRHRVDVKTATATSVVLMGGNALLGIIYCSTVGIHKVDPVAWNFWWVCAPIVVLGAPLGSWFVTKVSYTTVVAFLLSAIAAQYIAGIIMLPMSPSLWILTSGTILIGSAIFFAMAHRGKHANALPAATLEQIDSQPRYDKAS